MPKMYFNSGKAFEQLTTYGYVFTLRKTSKPLGSNLTLTKVQIWRNGEDTGLRGNKIYVATDNLYEFGDSDVVEASGFKSMEEWIAEAERLSSKHAEWNLFYVHLLEGTHA